MQIILHSSNSFLASFHNQIWLEALPFNLHERRCVNAPLQCTFCDFDLPFTLMVYSHLKLNFKKKGRDTTHYWTFQSVQKLTK